MALKIHKMSPRTDFANTPWYVLKRGNQPIQLEISSDDPEIQCVCIYGFSDKPVYDAFIKSVAQVLTPYPLVKGFLSSQIDAADSGKARGDRLQLVILDATDQAQPVLLAATMATVLLAQQEQAKQVPAEYELVFDPEIAGYRLSNDSNDVSAIDPLHVVR